MKRLPILCAIFLLLCCITNLDVSAQLPCAQAGLIYYVEPNGGLYNFDPTQPLSTTNPWLNTITPPPGGFGLAVSDNINGPGPSPTFYVNANGTYWYYDGTTWINTNHSTGGFGAVNPGGGGGYIYNLDGTGNGDVYRYDGTGNAILLMNIPGFTSGPADITVDCDGNFYVLQTLTTQSLKKYDPNGNVLITYTLTGVPTTNMGGGGLAVIGNNVYYDFIGAGFYTGVISGTVVNFTSSPSPNPMPYDFAVCAASSGSSRDTVYQCAGGPGASVIGRGQGPFTWTVLSGPATIAGTGDTVTVSSTSDAVILSQSSGSCGQSDDTIVLIVQDATVDAGPNSNNLICVNGIDTLTGSATSNHNWIPLAYNWTPATNIVSGGNTLQPVVNMSDTITYILTVTTPANQGGCVWVDSVTMGYAIASVTADFDTLFRPGCEADTVSLINNSTGFGTLYYNWDFGNGTNSAAINPNAIYDVQGTYTITLISSNGYCSDTASKPVTIFHHLLADFTTNKDSVCLGENVLLTNTTQASYPFTSVWDFRDGSSSTSQNSTHAYNQVGEFIVRLTVTDSIQCISIIEKAIKVANLSVAGGPKDTSVCLTERMPFYATVTPEGYFSNYTYAWTQDTLLANANTDTASFYTETAGDYNYVVTATGQPMGCIARDTIHINVQPRPVLINVSPDMIVEYGTQVQLNAEGVRYYIWTPTKPIDNPNISNPTATMLEPTVFTVQGMNEHGGCRDTATVKVDITYTDEYVPSVFSPNGDGLNDVFRMSHIKYQRLVEFRVFNRWGLEIYNTTNAADGWDGTYKGDPQEIGVYNYLIRVQIPNGEQRVYKGNVTLIR